jgi:hypothetical protein
MHVPFLCQLKSQADRFNMCLIYVTRAWIFAQLSLEAVLGPNIWKFLQREISLRNASDLRYLEGKEPQS